MIYKNKRKKGITSMKMNLKNKITFNICVIVTLSLVVMCTSLYAMSASILSEDSNTFTEVQILRAQEKIELQVDKIRLETLALSREQRVRNFFKGELGTDELNRFLTDTMEAILCILEDSQRDQKEAKALYLEKYPLDRAYQDWLKSDVSETAMLRDSIDDTAKDVVKERREKQRESR